MFFMNEQQIELCLLKCHNVEWFIACDFLIVSCTYEIGFWHKLMFVPKIPH